MKKVFFYLLLLNFFVITISAQIPAGYYNAADGLSGQELKTALYDIIKGHTEYPYTSSSTDVWDILKETDRDTANADNVILLYTGWSVNAAQEYNNGSGWNREHVWAKSRGDFGTSQGPGTDVHHLRPSDISVNSARNNRWFDNCTEPYYDGGVLTGSYTSSTEWVWKPRDEVKGDVARMIFYMATRYEGENGEPDLEVIDYIPADRYTTEPIHAKLSALLLWHQEDPVDDFERNRNEVIYSYQNNRNPFIDHPEWVEAIWTNQPPVIDSIKISPESPTENDIVDVNAYLIDDESIFGATLFWGFSDSDLSNEVTCYTTDGTSWVGQIPAQAKDLTVYFKVLAIDSKPDSTFSDILSYFVTGSTGIGQEGKFQSKVRIYPNPASDYVYISNPENLELCLFSIDGRKLSEILENEINMSGYSPGNYIVKAVDKKGIAEYFRILVNR